jgi:hypothetical protein
LLPRTAVFKKHEAPSIQDSVTKPASLEEIAVRIILMKGALDLPALVVRKIGQKVSVGIKFPIREYITIIINFIFTRKRTVVMKFTSCACHTILTIATKQL